MLTDKLSRWARRRRRRTRTRRRNVRDSYDREITGVDVVVLVSACALNRNEEAASGPHFSPAYDTETRRLARRCREIDRKWNDSLAALCRELNVAVGHRPCVYICFFQMENLCLSKPRRDRRGGKAGEAEVLESPLCELHASLNVLSRYFDINDSPRSSTFLRWVSLRRADDVDRATGLTRSFSRFIVEFFHHAIRSYELQFVHTFTSLLQKKLHPR